MKLWFKILRDETTKVLHSQFEILCQKADRTDISVICFWLFQGLGLYTSFLVQLAIYLYLNWVLIISYKWQVATNVV